MLECKLLAMKDVESKIEEYSVGEDYGKQAQKLRCLRGIDTITAMAIVSEIIDFKRFGSAREFMSYVG